MSNRTNPIRYIVRVPNQAIPASYNVGLGLKQAQLYADLTAKTYRGTIFAQGANGEEEIIGSYARQPYGADRTNPSPTT